MRKIIMVGPDINMKGGISAVNKTLLNSNRSAEDYVIKYIASYVDGSIFLKLFVAIKGLFQMLFLLLFFNPRIIHIHSASRGSFRRKYFYYLLARAFNKKIIYHIHGAEFAIYYAEASLFEKKKIIRVLENVDKVIALSNTWKNNLLKIAPSSNVEVVHNPVNIKNFKAKYNPSNEVNILFMGRLGKRKGVYDLLQAIEEIIISYPFVKLYLCGDGEINKVKEIIEKKNLSNNVFIPGWINNEEKIKYIQKSDIYILPSYNEGLPISILEAMAGSLPIISTKIGGIPEAVSQGENGYLFTPGNIKDMKMYLIKLIEDKPLRERLGKESLEICRNNFDIQIINKNIIKIYSLLY
ncbi:glycosyltransferase family 4 protein [Peribacillus sp. RS7]|uniref:glycosyltransferase family 4 protein n=1 Tax=Peribacillus sp. RS7 TaxID=3242679 RepID=UPI0035BF37CD